MLNERLRQFIQPPHAQTEKKILYLSGLAGSGKTTVAQILEKQLNAILLKEFLEPIPDSVVDTRVNFSYEDKVKAQKWILGQYAQKNDVLSNLSGNIVVDRTWVDALVYSKIYGDAVLQAISAEVERYDWQLGIYVILFADELVIKQRLSEKFGLTEKDWDNSWGPYIHDLRQSVIELTVESNFFALDTSNLNPESASAIIETQFKKHFGE